MALVNVWCPPCMYCGEQSLLAIEEDKLAELDQGELIQNVLPDWSPAQREQLITGTHPHCWDELFKDEMFKEEE